MFQQYRKLIIAVTVSLVALIIALVGIRAIFTGRERAIEGVTMIDDAEGGDAHSFQLSTFLDDDWDVGRLVRGSYQDIMDRDFSQDIGDLFILKVESEKTGDVRSIRMERDNTIGQKLKDMLIQYGYVFGHDQEEPLKLILNEESSGGVSILFRQDGVKSGKDLRFLVRGSITQTFAQGDERR